MTSELIKKTDLQDLSDLGNVPLPLADAYSGTARGPDSVSIQGNRFGLQGEHGLMPAPNPLTLSFAVIGLKKPRARVYYAGAFDPDNPAAPACMSYDGVVPDGGLELQAPACSVCKRAQWNSAVSKLTGKPVPACRQHKELAIKVMGIDGLWLFKIPPASFRAWDSAIKRVEDAARAHADASLPRPALGNCLMQASFAMGSGTGLLEFRVADYLSGDELVAVKRLHANQEAVTRMLWGQQGEARKAQWEISQKKDIDPPKEVLPKEDAPPRSRRFAQSPAQGEEFDTVMKKLGIS